MEDSWVGKAVSIQCSDKLGVFQGTIKDANSSQITIVRAFRNGVPLRKQDAEVTLSAADIIKLELIPTYNAQSTLNTTVINKPTPIKQPNFGAARESALSNKMSNMKLSNGQRKSPTSDVKTPKQSTSKSPSSNVTKFFGNMIPSKVEAKMAASSSHQETNRNAVSKPIDIANGGRSVPVPINNTPLKQEKKKARREQRFNRNQTFGTPVDDPTMEVEFDFEGNLALFDKRAVWDEIEARQKPDLLRGAASAQKKRYRHDENVLVSEPTQYRQIETMFQSSHDYVTDEGLIIPAIPLSLRSKIQQLAEDHGLTWKRQCDMLARGTAEMAISLLGGARRLTPNNQHQWPTVVIISDKPHNAKVSEVGAATGRQLASHGLKVMFHIKGQEICEKEASELDLFRATGNSVVWSVNDLPSSDLVILSVNSNNLSPSIKKWIVENSRAPVLAIDPPPNGVTEASIKFSILPVLPLNNISASCGKLYLCNIGIPDKFFRDAGIKYKSPFGHKFVIPIHMKD
uniref:Enhancer of mRNA-decapping protein 3 n=1 Tax=Tabanus bromius TaxID=304241 RepID=A0A0K8TNF9_TABBR